MGDEGATGGEGRCFARGESGDEEGAVARILESHNNGPTTTMRARGAERGETTARRVPNGLVGNRHWNSRELAGVCVSCPNNYNCFPWMTDNSELARIFAKNVYTSAAGLRKGVRENPPVIARLIDSPRDAFR